MYPKKCLLLNSIDFRGISVKLIVGIFLNIRSIAQLHTTNLLVIVPKELLIFNHPYEA